MPQTQEQTPDIQVQQGPDQKWYKVKKADQPKFDLHFTKQGWVKKDGNWFTQSGEPAKMSVPSGTPAFVSKGTPSGVGIGGGTRVGVGIEDKRKGMSSATTDYTGSALPTIGGGVGGMVGGTPGAAIGGGMGQIMNQIITRPSFLEADPSFKKQATDVMIEAGKQAAYEKGGQLIAKPFNRFFQYMLEKLPRATVKNGISFLPSEYKPGGSIYRYIEDLLGNLAPSKGYIDAFKEKQFQEVMGKAGEIVDGLTKVNGTSEEIGSALQKTLKQGQDVATKQLDAIKANYIKKGFSSKQADLYLQQTKLYKDFVEKYENELAQKIISTNKPELIAGWLTVGTKAANQETRILDKTLSSLDGNMMNRVRRQILSDTLWETIRGAKDPVLKNANPGKFGGDRFMANLDKIGEDKLKAIFGQEQFNRIQEFAKLTSTIGTGANGSGVGRFLNLMFMLPFRAGLKFDALTKTGSTAFILNRAAKIMTTPEGIKLWESYAKAVGQNLPRAINLTVEEIRKYNQRSDEEFELEQVEGEKLYQQMKGKK